ncbi:MAG TPA: sporulation protein YqfD [Syntrophomonadaceae bacterium]|nr:sporulation protein YqfD [Syntrophomonadaceae bacterium]HPR92587.1 sporulation protein YqfD [Syntrophomonadaceae bacterium]
MDNRILNQMEGIISVRLYGQSCEKVINMASMRGIYIWDIRREEKYLEFKIRKSAYEALTNIAADNNYQMEIIKVQGMPFFKKIIQRRSGFLSGALLFILAIYLMSSFIWFIEVENNQKIDTSTIVLTAAKHGLYKGAAKWSFSRSEVEKQILIDINQLSYVKVDIRGVKATIEVVEKILPGDEITGPCHIVAAKDGVVEEILLLEGQANAKEGEAVSKGDIIISGIVFYQPSTFLGDEAKNETEDVAPEIVRARGIVRARVWYEGYGECKRTSKKIVYTGRENRQIVIRTPWRDLIIRGEGDPGFKQFSQHMIKREIKSPLGSFGWLDVKTREKDIIVTRLSENEAVKAAREKAIQNLTARMKNHERPQDVKLEILSSPSDAVLRCRVAVEVLEDIAKAEPINEQ